MGNIHVKLYEIWTSVSAGDAILRHFLSRALATPLFDGLEPWHHEEKSCEIILNLDHWFRRKCCLKVFFIWSSGSRFVQHNHLCNFGRGYYEDQQCEII